MKRQLVVWATLGAVALWCFWALMPFLAWGWDLTWVPATMGQWGDTFGALNALASSFAFAAVLYTIWLQQQQIVDAQRDQHVQQFDRSYFELLRLFAEARKTFRYSYSREYRVAKAGRPAHWTSRVASTFEAQDAFRTAMLEFRYWLKEKAINRSDKAQISSLYITLIHNRYESKLGPYFRLMYTILQRISEDEKLTPREKARYGNILRSQLTSYEAGMAGLNALSPVSKDFSRLVIEFRLLKYLPVGSLRRTLERLYPSEAFAERD